MLRQENLAEDGKDIDYHCAEGESVHHVFLHAFLCFPDAQYVLSLFSTGVLCFTRILSVVVRFVVSTGNDVDSQQRRVPPFVDESM
jgi:hypothetical protein